VLAWESKLVHSGFAGVQKADDRREDEEKNLMRICMRQKTGKEPGGKTESGRKMTSRFHQGQKKRQKIYKLSKEKRCGEGEIQRRR